MRNGTGALESGYDIRDFWYNPGDRGNFDWDTGFDIENFIGQKITVKDQGKSSSCGGQAWAYYGEVLEKVATGSYEPRSARWIYSHTFVPTGGSRGRDNCDLVRKEGWVKESFATSYEDGKLPSEKFMCTVPQLSKEAIEDKEVSRAEAYIQVPVNINVIAQAIQDHYGVVMVLNGEDNGTWRTKFPQPPRVKEWGHFVLAAKAKMIDGKKYIGVLNSWGTDVGDKGWQWLGEEYFKSGHIREAWALPWDYKPARHKLLLIETIRLMKNLLNLLKK